MSLPQHTPGPWFYSAGVVTSEFVGQSEPDLVCENISARHVGGYASLAERQAVADANGRLIAAAPDLLAALSALTSNPHLNLGDQVYRVREIEGLGWEGPAVKAWSDAVSAARAALAKAEGRT